jgi:acetyl-CoA carboxylase biotin carboxyl carrier protein
MDLSHDDVKKILELIDASENLEEVEVAYGGFLLRIQRSGGAEATASPRPRVAAPPRAASTAAAPPPSKAARAELVLAPGEVAVRAPMLGTFYRAATPGAPAFVEIGQRVKADEVVCLIEVMKLFNSIKAGVDGVVTKILADNSRLVEFDQPLIVVSTSP